MYNYILTVKEKKKEKYNPITRMVEFSCAYDNLKLDNDLMGKYLNSMMKGNLKGYFVTDVKKVKEKKAD